ncbi:GTP cyclohydrolase I [Streptomyces sp. NPDC050804]|uniref:GTP cyclohydrolase I n=1 Tax=Streptomyces sp. NPDC050804 TaxID=3154745 RepID=UPI003416E949
MTTSVASPEKHLSATVPVPVPGAPAAAIDTARVAGLIAQLLAELGEDPAREGLIGTPDRVAAWWSAFLSPGDAATATCFTESQLSDQLVIVGGMSVWSLCEHHMLPMNLQVSAGYVPDGEVVGLSKFGRIAQHFAGRLQVQERFTRQVAEHLAGVIGREDVAVAVGGVHLLNGTAPRRTDETFVLVRVNPQEISVPSTTVIVQWDTLGVCQARALTADGNSRGQRQINGSELFPDAIAGHAIREMVGGPAARSLVPLCYLAEHDD